MKKRLYLALLVTLTTACVLTGCNGCNTTEPVEENTEIASEEVSEELTSETITSEEVSEEVSEETTEVLEEPVFEPYEAVVNYTANLRKEASIESEKMGIIVEGTTVTVLEELGQWSKIFYEEKEVYVLAQYLDKVESETEEVTQNTSETGTKQEETTEETPAYTVTDMEKIMYVQRSVNVRSGPGTNYEKLGALNTNDEVKVTGQADNGWYRIEYKGNEGFVSNNYLGDAKVVVNTTPTPAPDNNGTGNTTTTPETTTPSTPAVDTSNLTSKVVNGNTAYVYRTTANGTPIYELQTGYWPQYILDVINECCTPSMSDMEKAQAIHNWLVANITYDYSYASYTTYSTLNTRTAICNGYSNTYQSLCVAAGISTSVVCGRRDNYEHAWNYIYINNTKYFTDVTNNRGIYTNIVITQDSNGTLMEVYDTNGKIQSRWYITGEYWNGYLDTL